MILCRQGLIQTAGPPFGMKSGAGGWSLAWELGAVVGLLNF